MLNGIYSCASAMDVAAKQHEVIANNLANASVPGFRRTLLAVSADRQGDLAPGDGGSSNIYGSRVVGSFADQSQGALIRTDRPLDLAVNGEGFFVLETPAGTRYTRNGSFHLTADGQMVTAEGAAVVGEGSLVFDNDVALSKVTFDADGTIRANGQELGKLRVVAFDDMQRLIQTGPTQFEAPAGLSPVPADGIVVQGSLESANTGAVDEMIAMIIGMRHFEAAQQCLRSISEVIQQYTTLQ
jgi:flagellar basal body rod protein FlgG